MIAPVAVLAGGGGNPAERDCTPAFVLDNDETRIWFQALKAHFQISDIGDDGEVLGTYSYQTAAIVELDADGNELARMNLERAFPQTSECEMTVEDEWVNLTIEITDAVRGPGDADLGDATVTLKHHFNQTDDGGKFDLIVDAWPWQGEGELAYDFRVHSDQYTIEEAENGLGFSDAEGNDAGHVDWAMNATATYDDEPEEEAIVDSIAEISEDGHDANVRLQYTQAAPGYVNLLHDPWFGNGGWLILANLILVSEEMVPVELPRELWDLV